MEDKLNPNYVFSMTDGRLLAEICEGQHDPRLLARKELANRGLNMHGQWIGFKQAEEEYIAYVKQINRKPDEDEIEAVKSLGLLDDDEFDAERSKAYDDAVSSCNELANMHFDFKGSASIYEMRDMVVEVIREYLHGSADVEDCSSVTWEQYISVAQDIFLSLDNMLLAYHDFNAADDDGDDVLPEGTGTDPNNDPGNPENENSDMTPLNGSLLP